MPDAGVALVTGASGFVGSHLVEQLVASGRRVRCLMRERSSVRWLPRAAIELAQCSLRTGEGLERAVEGVAQIYHLAAATSAVHAAEYERVNVGGTEHLMRAAERFAGDAVVVFCSSLAAAGPAPRGRPLVESDPPHPIGPYGASKLAAEQVMIRGRLRYVIVRPPTVYGPRDRDIVVMVRWIAHGFVPRIGPRDQELSLVHASDLARGLLLVAERADGEIYYLTDGVVHLWSDVIREVGDAVGRRPREIPVPPSVAITAAAMSRAAARLTRAKPLLTSERICDLRQEAWTCDDAKAQRRLGWAPSIGVRAGMRETVRWYREHGWL